MQHFSLGLEYESVSFCVLGHSAVYIKTTAWVCVYWCVHVTFKFYNLVTVRSETERIIQVLSAVVYMRENLLQYKSTIVIYRSTTIRVFKVKLKEWIWFHGCLIKWWHWQTTPTHSQPRQKRMVVNLSKNCLFFSVTMSEWQCRYNWRNPGCWRMY